MPSEKHDYSLRIISIENQLIETAPYFEEAEVWFTEAHSIVAYKTMQGFGEVVRDKDETQIEELRPLIEFYYLENRAVEYELVRRTYQPIDRFQRGAFINEEVVTRFQSKGDGS